MKDYLKKNDYLHGRKPKKFGKLYSLNSFLRSLKEKKRRRQKWRLRRNVREKNVIEETSTHLPTDERIDEEDLEEEDIRRALEKSRKEAEKK